MTKNIINIDAGKLGEAPNDKWKKFFDMFSEVETLENSKWKPAHLIGYFCKKYQAAYNIKYSFKFNSPNPPKSFEVFQIKKLAMLLSSDPSILTKYIDWAFDKKVKEAKRRLTSISFLTNEELVNDYKINYLLNDNSKSNFDRSTPLPTEYKNLFNDFNGSINTYGDLSFMYSSSSQDAPLKNAFNKLEELGFNLDNLNKIV